MDSTLGPTIDPPACPRPWSRRSTRVCGGPRAQAASIFSVAPTAALIATPPPTDATGAARWTGSGRRCPGREPLHLHLGARCGRSAEQERQVLYNVAFVELDGTEGDPVRMASNVLDAWNPDDLYVGQAVELACVPLGDGIGLPCFRRVR